MPESEVWIGLIEYKYNAKKGFSNVLAYACSIKEFVENVTEVFDYYKMEIVNIEDVESFSERVKKYEVSSELVGFSEEIKKNNNLVKIGTFHCYE